MIALLASATTPKSGYSDDGPAWIGRVKASRSGRTIYFNGRALRQSKGPVGYLVLAAFLLVAASAIQAEAQSSPTPMELNRAGRWLEAAAVARALLKDAEAPPATRCELRSQLIYALVRTGDRVAATAEIDRFDATCSILQADHWARREVDGLRGEVETVRPAPVGGSERWTEVDPAAIGLNVAALVKHERLCRATGAAACLVTYRGQIVQEWYGPSYREPMHAMSSTKSVTGLLVGMLIADGSIQSSDQRVCSFLPTWCEGLRGRATIRHLLTMTSGLPAMPDSSVGFVAQKNDFVSGLHPTAEPGTRWVYSNEGVQLLSPILERAAGEAIHEYARERLFERLGMRQTTLHVLNGEAWTYADMETTPRDLARIGRLMLQNGRWKGEQVVPAEWVEASVTASQALMPEYGLLWWLDVPGGFAARGYLDTNLYVLPDRDMVVVRIQSEPAPDAPGYEPAAFELFREFVPSSMQ